MTGIASTTPVSAVDFRASFFAEPQAPFQGWERAVDAQARVWAAWQEVLQTPGEVVIVGHGGTGTLLMCQLAGLPISREYDAPGQGCVWVWDRARAVVVSRWRAMA